MSNNDLIDVSPQTPSGLPVTPMPISDLVVADRHVRVHPAKQIALIQKSIQSFGFTTPLVVGTGGKVLAGAARLQAAQQEGMTDVPVISLAHLREAEQRAYMLADNKLAELASWDEDILKLELADLSALELGFDLTDLGFSAVELDQFIHAPVVEVAGETPPPDVQEIAVSRIGDVWLCGGHRLICGDARDPAAYAALMQGEKARMVFTDPPFNVPISRHVTKTVGERREFPMACGEMTVAEFTEFLKAGLGAAAACCMDGSIHYVCMDWRHMGELLAAGAQAIGELKNLCIWTKPNAGMGSFYRSQMELVFVYKKGGAPHLNNFGLGGDGRYRTNVWKYAGASGFHAERDQDLAYHPTAKPVAMVADAILDVSAAGDIVLDPFGGSGATLMAAELTGRRARLIELDPLYVDVICRRFLAAGGEVTLEGGGSFSTVEAERAGGPVGPEAHANSSANINGNTAEAA